MKVSLRFEAFPAARKEFRTLPQGLLPTIYDLTNDEILRQARAWLARTWLAQPEHGGYGGTAIIVDQLDRAVGEDEPTALFVYGLESMLDLRLRQSPAMGLLNLNRDYCWQHFPWPVIFIASLFAMREFARQAPDFWSGRTGVYRFTGDRDDIKEALAGLESTSTGHLRLARPTPWSHARDWQSPLISGQTL